MLEYHLKILRTNKVTVERHDGRRARYYAIYISPEDGHLLDMLAIMLQYKQ
ncbi:MAG: hypothetical protein WCF23_15775 [Candidatus Nitrosopolaris sp.]